MVIENVQDYLLSHKFQKISVGQSGADVYIVDNTLILKYARHDIIGNPNIWNSYVREARFYEAVDRTMLPCIPEVVYMHYNSNEVILLMKKYRMVGHNEIDYEMLVKIIKALVKVHIHPLPEFLKQNETEIGDLSSMQISECVNGWKEVLSEHHAVFDEYYLEHIAKEINEIIRLNQLSEKTLVHGDFHCDNLLMDIDQNVLICDWQGTSEGNAAGDLSFFISRLSADNLCLSEHEIISLYCDCYKKECGIPVDRSTIKRSLEASNLITSFVFWHQYLHKSEEKRVRGIYEKMVHSFLAF